MSVRVALIYSLFAVLSTPARAEIAVTLGQAFQAFRYSDQGALIGLANYPAQVESIAYDPSGNLLAILGVDNGPATLVGLPNQNPVALGTIDGLPRLAVSPTGEIAVALGDSRVYLYNPQGQLTNTLSLGSTVDALAYDRSGNLLAIIGVGPGPGALVGLPNQPPLILGNISGLPNLTVSPTGEVATGLGDNTVSLFDEQGHFLSGRAYSDSVNALGYEQAGELLAIVGHVSAPGILVGLLSGNVALGTLNGPSLATFIPVPEPASLLLMTIGLAGTLPIATRRLPSFRC